MCSIELSHLRHRHPHHLDRRASLFHLRLLEEQALGHQVYVRYGPHTEQLH